MLEYEMKVLLNRDEYEVIAKRCNDNCVENQINYYFDTDDLYMNKNGVTCRIRAKNGKYKMTIKNHCVQEENCSVEEDVYEGDVLDSRIFDALGLKFMGELVTSRMILHKDKVCEMVIDKNYYLGHTDYEIEIEYSKEAEQKALGYLKSIAVCLTESKIVPSVEMFLDRIGKGDSKSNRFFERKEKY